MLEAKFHPDTIKLMEADEYHELDTRFLRRKLNEIKLETKNELITFVDGHMSCKDNIVHVSVLGKMGYTFRRVKHLDSTIIVIM